AGWRNRATQQTSETPSLGGRSPCFIRRANRHFAKNRKKSFSFLSKTLTASPRRFAICDGKRDACLSRRTAAAAVQSRVLTRRGVRLFLSCIAPDQSRCPFRLEAA